MPNTERAPLDELTVRYSKKTPNTVVFTLSCGCAVTALLDCPNQFGDPTQFRHTCYDHFDW